MRKPIDERFWDHVEKSDGCWIWTAYRDKDGYGTFALNRYQPIQAHRFAWFLANGSDPGAFMVCHKCDNPPCVRPDHLFLGDSFANQRDSANKKRQHHARKTHCPKGHPYSGDNLIIRKQQRDGGIHRTCRTCHNEQSMATWLKKKTSASLSQNARSAQECIAP